MRMLTSPFHYIKTQRARRKQVRKALQMLSVSGVVRPGHIERRYFAQATQVDALYRQVERPVAVSPAQPSQDPIPLWQREVKIDLSRIRHWVGALRPARLQVGQ
jgi:hypothetical protein